MKFISYASGNGSRAAALVDGRYVDVNSADSTLPVTLKELVALGSEGLAKAASAAKKGAPLAGEVRVLAPIPDPQKVICVGLN